MTAQEIFEKALFGMIEQGRLGSVKNRVCLYRDPEGNCCGVGLLVSPEQAAEWDAREDSSAIGDLALEPEFPEQLKEHAELLQSIQFAHDRSVRDELGLPGYVRTLLSIGAAHKLSADTARIPSELLPA